MLLRLFSGLTIDEALKQLKFFPQKGCRVVEEVLEEAREMAVKEHHFEYATNMYILLQTKVPSLNKL